MSAVECNSEKSAPANQNAWGRMSAEECKKNRKLRKQSAKMMISFLEDNTMF